MWRFLYLDCVLRFKDLGLNWLCHSWSMPYDATTFCTCGLRVQRPQWQELHLLCHTNSLVFHCNVPWTPLEVLCYNKRVNAYTLVQLITADSQLLQFTTIHSSEEVSLMKWLVLIHEQRWHKHHRWQQRHHAATRTSTWIWSLNSFCFHLNLSFISV
jgi:hypothetical protein